MTNPTATPVRKVVVGADQRRIPVQAGVRYQITVRRNGCLFPKACSGTLLPEEEVPAWLRMSICRIALPLHPDWRALRYAPTRGLRWTTVDPTRLCREHIGYLLRFGSFTCHDRALLRDLRDACNVAHDSHRYRPKYFHRRFPVSADVVRASAIGVDAPPELDHVTLICARRQFLVALHHDELQRFDVDAHYNCLADNRVQHETRGWRRRSAYFLWETEEPVIHRTHWAIDGRLSRARRASLGAYTDNLLEIWGRGWTENLAAAGEELLQATRESYTWRGRSKDVGALLSRFVRWTSPVKLSLSNAFGFGPTNRTVSTNPSASTRGLIGKGIRGASGNTRRLRKILSSLGALEGVQCTLRWRKLEGWLGLQAADGIYVMAPDGRLYLGGRQVGSQRLPELREDPYREYDSRIAERSKGPQPVTLPF